MVFDVGRYGIFLFLLSFLMMGGCHCVGDCTELYRIIMRPDLLAAGQRSREGRRSQASSDETRRRTKKSRVYKFRISTRPRFASGRTALTCGGTVARRGASDEMKGHTKEV